MFKKKPTTRVEFKEEDYESDSDKEDKEESEDDEDVNDNVEDEEEYEDDVEEAPIKSLKDSKKPKPKDAIQTITLDEVLLNHENRLKELESSLYRMKGSI